LASELGLVVQAEDPIPGIVNYLRDRRALVVLDCCEHVIASAAAVAEGIFRETASIRILVTSREPLRCEGEQVFPLSPLRSPPETSPASLEDLLNYPAALLFHDRIVAGGHRTELTGDELAVVAEICRKVDGVALALELAAARVNAHGLGETAALLDSHLKLTWLGRSAAPERHQTLNATLDWSHDLASVPERAVLRRLSALVGPFTLEEAQAVGADEAIDGGQVIECLGQLVAKSLILADGRRTPTRYRLLDTTRAYAQAKLVGSGEESRTARAHAMLCERLLRRREELGDEGADGGMPAEVLGNVRAALDWCFRPGGDLAVGVRLAAAATQFLFDLSLLRECREWAERALSVLSGEADQHSEMALCSALGHGLMFTRGGGDASRAALERGLEIAVSLGDSRWRFRLLAGLHMYQRRLGDFRQLLPIAQEAQQLAMEMSDPAALSAAQAMLGVTQHLSGDLASARDSLTASLRAQPGGRPVTANAFGFNRDTRILLARTLWLQGYPDQAVREARKADPFAPQDPVSACLALIWNASLLHWVGDWDREESLLVRLVQLATEHSLEPYKWVGVGFQGDLRVQRGDAETGVEMMRNALNTLRAGGYVFNTPWLGSNLAAGLAVLGHVDQALRHMDEALAATGPDTKVYNLPDLWRIQGEILAQAGDLATAQDCFDRSIALADEQGALSWRLRTAMSFARLAAGQGRPTAGREILAETYSRFREGFETVDLVAARTLLEDLP
jgi:predicted ATPase